jgi:hypothetical protein
MWDIESVSVLLYEGPRQIRNRELFAERQRQLGCHDDAPEVDL